jgi:molybdopterin-containing oxidoreductase family iron-sulfur binding subunit
MLNEALGNFGETVRIVPDTGAIDFGSLEDLAKAASSLQTLVVLGGNPVYDAPVDVGFGDVMASVATTVHLGMFADETAAKSTWHVPQSHYLEAWGDLRASDGTVSIQQPLIAPLFEITLSDIEILARLVGEPSTAGYDVVRATWQAAGGQVDEKSWRKALHAGVAPASATSAAPIWNFNPVAAALPKDEGGLDVVFAVDSKVADGRYANNPWLQELPDPVSKLTWDNAALVGPATADKLGVRSEEMGTLSVGGRSLELATFIVPGIADDTVVVPLGYGRERGGRIASGCGWNAFALQTSANPAFASGGQLQGGGRGYELATTQAHGDMAGRAIVREATLDEYRNNPLFTEEREVLPPEKVKSLPIMPELTGLQQWGMSIDLNACIGCNACTMACNAENNISYVGKERVLKGREMHWIRLDRYFTGDMNDPEAVFQPVGCAHCEMAPCETVCPVAATAHSPEGLNDIAYNRCIGTRYCANNCPFKVRRFNFFNFSKENDEDLPLLRLQRNPDVTVRFRGVIEKCTYCVQRIQQAKIEAKRDGKDLVADGAIVPACAQTCPTEAIVFGDIKDPESRVSKHKKNERNYVLLRELAIFPRTSYLARVRNPNPELV